MPAKSIGLGRGLGALLGDDSLRNTGGGGISLRLTDVEPNLKQPRRLFDEEALVSLAESIRIHGVLQPLLVRLLPTGYYQIIAGERRWRAARLAGLAEVPAIVMDLDDRKAAEMALIENLQREDLTPLEEADGFKVLTEEYGLTQEEVGARVGRSRSAVANSLRLLTLPESLQSLLREGRLTAGHARSLLSLGEPSLMEKVAGTIMSRSLSVRQSEALCRKLNDERAGPAAASAAASASTTGADGRREAEAKDPPNYLADYERDLTRILSRKVTITASGQKGRLSMEFYDPVDLEQLVKTLTWKGAGSK